MKRPSSMWIGLELKRHLHRGYEAARQGAWDPAARLADQDADGIGCEVLYPTHAMRLFSLPDADLQRPIRLIVSARLATRAV